MLLLAVFLFPFFGITELRGVFGDEKLRKLSFTSRDCGDGHSPDAGFFRAILLELRAECFSNPDPVKAVLALKFSYFCMTVKPLLAQQPLDIFPESRQVLYAQSQLLQSIDRAWVAPTSLSFRSIDP